MRTASTGSPVGSGSAPGTCGGFSCCTSEEECDGSDAAWHFHDGSSMRYVGPSLSNSGSTNCTTWNGTVSSSYIRLTACEGTPTAQTLDVGTHLGTYTGSATRGYWMTAPVAFRITALRVPTIVGSGAQHVEVIRFNSTPSAGTTSDFVSLGRWINDPGGWINTDIQVNAGETIGVLGTKGTTIMNSSYAASGMLPTTVNGYTASLGLLMFADSLFQNPLDEVDVAVSGNVGRVETQYY